MNALITSYLQSHLPDPLKDKANEFAPILLRTIKAICKNWLARVKEQAGEVPNKVFSGTLLDPRNRYDILDETTLSGVSFYDQKGIELICQIFASRYQIKASPQLVFHTYDDFDNSLMNVLPKGHFYEVHFQWNSSNSYIYANTVRNFVPEILGYLERNLPLEESKKAGEYLPRVKVKIDVICQKWLDIVKKQAETTPKHIFQADLLRNNLGRIDFLDKEGGELVLMIFQSRFDIYVTPVNDFDQDPKTNSLLDILPRATAFEARFTWAPSNYHVYTHLKRGVYKSGSS